MCFGKINFIVLVPGHQIDPIGHLIIPLGVREDLELGLVRQVFADLRNGKHNLEQNQKTVKGSNPGVDIKNKFQYSITMLCLNKPL